MTEIIIRYIHFLGIFVLFSTLVAEHTLLKHEITQEQIKRISIIDAGYGVSAIVVLVTGLLQWLVVGKPADFYTANPVFLAKVAIFIVVGILSIYPTLMLARSRKSQHSMIQVPRRIVMLVRAELALLIVMPLLAVMMARGYGLS